MLLSLGSLPFAVYGSHCFEYLFVHEIEQAPSGRICTGTGSVVLHLHRFQLAMFLRIQKLGWRPCLLAQERQNVWFGLDLTWCKYRTHLLPWFPPFSKFSKEEGWLIALFLFVY